MAVYIRIWKVNENEQAAEYEFGEETVACGRLRIVKETGEIVLISPLLNDESGKLFARVRYKLGKHLESGELPERTCWAS